MAIKQSNVLLHELGHPLSLFHPTSNHNIFHDPDFDCVMQLSGFWEPNNSYYYCPYCLTQLSQPKLIAINVANWLEVEQENHTCKTPIAKITTNRCCEYVIIFHSFGPLLFSLSLITFVITISWLTLRRYVDRRMNSESTEQSHINTSTP